VTRPALAENTTGTLGQAYQGHEREKDVGMFRFVHTSDWQLGMMATGLGAAAEKVRAARLDAVKNVLCLANDRRVDAILLAGDLFEHNQVSTRLIEQVAGVLNDHTRIPTYIIPGNHDAYSRDSLYRRPIWGQLREHVHVLTKPEPVALTAEVTLFPCPLLRRHGMDDPTAWIPQRGNDGGGLRVGIAHGTLRIREDVGDDDFPIALDSAAYHGLDYLALGHWHSTLSDTGGRCWYSGTHETTSFGERESGNALVVTCTGPGTAPHVETARTGTLSWSDCQIDVDRQDLNDEIRKYREWPHADRCLLRLALAGQTSPQLSSRLGDLAAVLQTRFLYHVCDESRLRAAQGTLQLSADLAGSPHLSQTARQL
jgi:DNA repair exonuclease SbcCD nuclease subunit